MGDIFAKIFAMTDCKVASESYITSYRNQIKDVIWKCFLILQKNKQKIFSGYKLCYKDSQSD